MCIPNQIQHPYRITTVGHYTNNMAFYVHYQIHSKYNVHLSNLEIMVTSLFTDLANLSDPTAIHSRRNEALQDNGHVAMYHKNDLKLYSYFVTHKWHNQIYLCKMWASTLQSCNNWWCSLQGWVLNINITLPIMCIKKEVIGLLRITDTKLSPCCRRF